MDFFKRIKNFFRYKIYDRLTRLVLSHTRAEVLDILEELREGMHTQVDAVIDDFKNNPKNIQELRACRDRIELKQKLVPLAKRIKMMMLLPLSGDLEFRKPKEK